jgi:hypothetical protein
MTLLSLVALMLCAPLAATAASLCSKGEVDYFSCKVAGSAKSISLCGSALHAAGGKGIGADAWLQYRYGTPGKPELVYPAKKEPLSRHFEGHSMYTGDILISALTFKRDADLYEVIDSQDNTFVGVTGPGKAFKFDCDGPATGPRTAKQPFAAVAKELSELAARTGKK